MSGRSLTISNTKKQLLVYVKYLLEKLGIETSLLYVQTNAGTKLADPKTGRMYFRKNDCFSFAVKSPNLPMFERSVGFTIGRKTTALRNACLETRQNSHPCSLRPL